MAHFTKVDESNIVTETVVIHNDCCLDSENNESEAVGIAFCEGLFGAGTYKQTSYNTLGGVHSLVKMLFMSQSLLILGH